MDLNANPLPPLAVEKKYWQAKKAPTPTSSAHSVAMDEICMLQVKILILEIDRARCLVEYWLKLCGHASLLDVEFSRPTIQMDVWP